MKLRMIDPDTYVNVGIGNVAAVKKRFGQIEIVLSSGEVISASPGLSLEQVLQSLEGDA